MQDKSEFYCEHRSKENKCELSCKKCDTDPQVCLYYKIYEKGYNDGYSEGKLGEDW